MSRLQQWRRWIRPLVMAVYILILVVALPLMIIELQRMQTEANTQEWFIGGMFVLLTLPISLWGILQHLVHYTQPILQRHIIRILWMVPIYAINAWFALKFPKAAIYLDTARECYEAYVIYNFMSYLINFLRMEHPDLEAHIATKPQIKHLPPICCVPPWRMGNTLMNRCRHGVVQYTVVRVLTTFVAFVCAMSGEEYYGEGKFNFKSAWSYLIVINNISQIFAMYCLILFYKATKEELSSIRPVAKFMCVKAVVFLSFWNNTTSHFMLQMFFGLGSSCLKNAISCDKRWATVVLMAMVDDYVYQSLVAYILVGQSILIAIIANTVPLEAGMATSIQDLVICIEMFFAAIAHYFSFSHRPFIDPAADNQGCCESFKSMWDVSDVQKDVVDHIRHVGSTASGFLTAPLRHSKPVLVHDSEMTPLLKSGESGDEIYSSSAEEKQLYVTRSRNVLTDRDTSNASNHSFVTNVATNASSNATSNGMANAAVNTSVNGMANAAVNTAVNGMAKAASNNTANATVVDIHSAPLMEFDDKLLVTAEVYQDPDSRWEITSKDGT